MTNSEFRSALKSLGLRQSWLAARLGVAQSTVNHWATGKAPVAPYVPFLLELLRDSIEKQQVETLIRQHIEEADGDMRAYRHGIRRLLNIIAWKRERRDNGKPAC